MTIRFLWALCALTAVFALSRMADAAGPSVALEEPSPATCVTRGDLTSALERAGVALEEREESEADAVTIRVTGTPAALVVSIQGGGFDATQALHAATCETATDVVAAFVTSALAPAPEVDVGPPPKPPLDVRALDQALGRELARHDVQLAVSGIKLTLFRSSGVWKAELAKRDEPSCSRTVSLGDFDELSRERVASAAEAITGVVHEFEDCPKGTRWLPTRAAYLESAVSDALEHEHRLQMPWLFVVEGALLGTVFTVSAVESPTKSNVIGASSSGFLLAGGVTALLVNDDYVLPVERTFGLGAIGGLVVARAYQESNPDLELASAVSMTSGAFATMALVTASAAIRRPPVTRLRADHRLIATESDRLGVSRRQVKATENDLRDLDPPIPDWVTYSPLLVGGLAATVPGISKGRFDTGVWYGLWMALLGGFSMVHHSYFGEYQDALRKAGLHDLALGGGPGDLGGISLSGRF